MSANRTKGGKPRHRADMTLDRNVNIRLAAVELEQIKATASRHGLTVSSYMRLAGTAIAESEPELREHILTAGSAIPDLNQQELIHLEYDPDNAATTRTDYVKVSME